mmetsp:Transcript_4436/g.13460  ORF Transcript_4436/g.13460 Transcript_4436/m.13460 type:complete len:420 (+) Transcript_4436:237-1496(+)|eukprot:CAMPEP_0198728112 /NCGR_PEP_ID=MMETSP1475-20131203/6910_1 /TAXON_ID= ORGANISM="Unidentified sp., Strain CCMP1999" /NCGR_SAMPLE_ID=MMETSP1475 /ASSEMBLY_ACC=CAM_ASM_001111 /LENGTH=419 /DNA_ID=CAMNT_0044490375 /DNA_START=158 /DNA_END=1417 /DNA_ORIENTATION=-
MAFVINGYVSRARCRTQKSERLSIFKRPQVFVRRCSRRCSIVNGLNVQSSGAQAEDVALHVESDSGRLIEFLADFWQLVCDIIDGKHVHASRIILTAPQCKSMREGWVIQRLVEYLNSCQDICNDFGETVAFKATRDEENSLAAFTLTKQAEYNVFGTSDEDDWDDWGDMDMSILDKYKDGEEKGTGSASKPELVPKNDEMILKKTFDWVQAIVVDMGICPFTSSTAAKAGLPIGDVRYEVCRDVAVERLYRAYWEELSLLLRMDQTSLSTTLLITPEFCTENADGFDAFSATLTSPLASLGVERDFQLVFFHPRYCFRDGAQRLGDDSAANYARRSPWPMINILRTQQVRAAQRVIPTGLVYKQNEDVLKDVGSDTLENMLQQRDWEALSDRGPVDRRHKNPARELADKMRKQAKEEF